LPLPLDLDLEIAFARLVTDQIELADGGLGVTADAERAAVDLTQLQLYDGAMTGRLAVANGAPLAIEAQANATGVQLEPLLAAVADLDMLAGSGNLELAVSSQGDSIAALIGALAGEGRVLARDGALLGINIGATMRQVMTLGTASAAGEPLRTDFAEAGGSFTITDGIVENRDFALRAPILRVSGAGTVDLPAQRLDYRLEPRLASTLQGQDAASDAAFQAGVPIVVEGPWAEPAIRLDLGGGLTGDISDPAALAETLATIAGDPAMLEELRDSFGIDADSPLGDVLEGLSGVLGSPEPSSGDSGSAPSRDPAGQLLEGLGGLLRR
jgi:AsmA protein